MVALQLVVGCREVVQEVVVEQHQQSVVGLLAVFGECLNVCLLLRPDVSICLNFYRSGSRS